MCTVQCAVGWSDFEKEKNAILCMLCQKVVGPQFQNVMSLCCMFTCRRASENCECYPEMTTQKIIFLFLKVVPETKFVL